MAGYLAGLGIGMAVGMGLCLGSVFFRRLRQGLDHKTSGTTGIAAR